ncbi:MAG TPA: MSMEG_0570 family nitrogen starvation response protein [Rhodopila sp.]|uniref:MSMEG_0570 family nitrogen starvation response protein n=1 Tax=Rhodopila sp. TaxID=2480087 RepID=UPI002CB54812|nr:MSMEG_0570 family nitrogen starvation response protein [Rhodopila sp.]HVY14598.1 MSMEG_0570 family nitrogen starvation response protein [Rhodopila sp.]
MPELRFIVRWPDGSRETCYSPSTIVRDHFLPGSEYTLPEFLARSRTALTAASERVRARYGSPCSLALGQLARIEATADRFADQPDALVFFETFQE